MFCDGEKVSETGLQLWTQATVRSPAHKASSPHGEEVGAPPRKGPMKKWLAVLGLDKEILLGEEEHTSFFWAPDLEGLRLQVSG